VKSFPGLCISLDRLPVAGGILFATGGSFIVRWKTTRKILFCSKKVRFGSLGSRASACVLKVGFCRFLLAFVSIKFLGSFILRPKNYSVTLSFLLLLTIQNIPKR